MYRRRISAARAGLRCITVAIRTTKMEYRVQLVKALHGAGVKGKLHEILTVSSSASDAGSLPWLARVSRRSVGVKEIRRVNTMRTKLAMAGGALSLVAVW